MIHPEKLLLLDHLSLISVLMAFLHFHGQSHLWGQILQGPQPGLHQPHQRGVRGTCEEQEPL